MYPQLWVIIGLIAYLAPPAAVAAFSDDLGRLKRSFAWPLSLRHLPHLCVEGAKCVIALVRISAHGAAE